MKRLFILFAFNFLLFTSFAQQKQIDSLKQIIATEKQDSNIVKSLLLLGKEYKHIDIDTSLYFFDKALKIAKDKSLKKQEPKILSNIASIYRLKGDYQNALKFFEESLNKNKKIGNQYGIAASSTNLGVIYKELGNYDKALKYYLKALKIDEKTDDKTGIAIDCGNIGNIYYLQQNNKKALTYYKKALKADKIVGDSVGIAADYGNIGLIYGSFGEGEKALKYSQKSFDINKRIGYKFGMAMNLGNIGAIYNSMGKLKKSLEFNLKALELFREIGNKNGVAGSLTNIADFYLRFGKYQKSLKFAEEALKLAKETGALDIQKIAYLQLSDIFERLNNFKKALKYKKEYIAIKDSIFNDEKRKSIAKLEAKYEYEKKAAMDSIANAKQIEIKNAQIAKINTEKDAQRKQRNFLLIGLILILIFVAFVIRSYIQKQKANKLLSKQKQEISEKNGELNQQNEEIRAQRDEIEYQKNILENIYRELDQSITYATRLQQSILPAFNVLTKNVNDYFVLFRPKDKVSGDFYWWTHIKNHTIITVADCTGHGVPGAFMSMLGVSLLREIVEKDGINNSAEILNRLRNEIIKSLKQRGIEGEQKDGMDMAIISINHENNVVQFSGANNPLYIIKPVIARRNDVAISTNNEQIVTPTAHNDDNNYELYEIKPDKMPIAIYEKMDNFTTHEFKVEKGDLLYLFSDGYADQFGGEKGKKFKYKPFKRLLLENADKPMKEQKEILEKTFNNWIQGYEQIDDVTVLGIKL